MFCCGNCMKIVDHTTQVFSVLIYLFLNAVNFFVFKSFIKQTLRSLLSAMFPLQHVLGGSHDSTDGSTPSSVCGSSPAPSPATSHPNDHDAPATPHDKKRSSKNEDSRSISSVSSNEVSSHSNISVTAADILGILNCLV